MSADGAREEAEREWPMPDDQDAALCRMAFVKGWNARAAQPVVVSAEQVEAGARALFNAVYHEPAVDMWDRAGVNARADYRRIAHATVAAALVITAEPTS
jgi:hypothetical protein